MSGTAVGAIRKVGEIPLDRRYYRGGRRLGKVRLRGSIEYGGVPCRNDDLQVWPTSGGGTSILAENNAGVTIATSLKALVVMSFMLVQFRFADSPILA